MGNEDVIAAHLNYLRRRGDSKTTIRHREDNLRRLARTLPVPILEATPHHLQEWQQALWRRVDQGEIDIVTLHIYCCHVRSTYAWAVDEAELLDYNPASKLRLPKLPRRKSHPIPEDDLNLVMRAALAIKDGHLMCWFALAGYAGLRSGEIAAIRRDDLFKEGAAWMLVVHGKGQKERVVPVPDEVVALMQPYLHKRGQIFRRPTSGVPVTSNDVTRQTSQHMRNLGLPWVLHRCRHRFGTALKDLGLDVREIQELLGHESLNTTSIYVHSSAGKATPFVAELGSKLRRGPVSVSG